MTITRKMVGGYVIVVALLVIVAGAASYSIQRIQQAYSGFLEVNERLAAQYKV